MERYWHKMLCSRSWAGRITWDVFHQIKQRLPILRPKLYLPYKELQALAVLCPLLEDEPPFSSHRLAASAK